MTLALTAEGLQIETFDEIRDGINASLRDQLGPIDLSDDAIEGMVVAIVSDRLANVDKLIQRVYSAIDPDASGGAALESLSSISGTLRQPARKSAAFLTVVGDAGTTVDTTFAARVPGAAVRWEVQTTGLVAAATAWGTGTTYAKGDDVTNAGNLYRCTVGGLSGPGPTSTDPTEDIADGTARWRFVGVGVALVDVTAAASEAGPEFAAAGDITDIVTPTAGVASVVNLTDAALGNDVEDDEDLRKERVLNLATPGTSPIDAVYAALAEVPGVTNVVLFYNWGDFTSDDGIPAHAVEALVEGGLDQVIMDTLLANVAFGIRTHGNTAGLSSDSRGNQHVMKFTRPSPIDVYVHLDVAKNQARYPNDGDEQVKAAVVLWSESELSIGYDVDATAVAAQAFAVSGVLGCPAALISTSPAPTDTTTISITVREKARFDTSRITVASTNRVP